MEKEVTAFGTNIVVEKVVAEDSAGIKSGFVIANDPTDVYAVGVVKSLGCMVELLDELGLEEGVEVLYLKEKANKVGNGFPDNLVIINTEDIGAVLGEGDAK
jgi:hypothetical protein